MRLPDWINFEKWSESFASFIDWLMRHGIGRKDPPAEPWQAPNKVTKVKRKKPNA